jgi:glycine/sarcosine/betaine reductase selenoprotein B
MAEEHKETFEEFRQSLNYGTRTDLLFKVLGGRNLGDGDVAEFFRGLLEILGDAFDTGNYATVYEYCVRWQVKGYMPREGAPPQFQYDTAPWAPLAKPLNQARLALISTGGVFVEGHDPLGPTGPTQDEAVLRIQEFLRGAPALASIPRDTPASRLRVRHPGYDIRGTLRDHNVVFPLDHLKALEAEGLIGELAEEAYSFVGATSQVRLLKEHAPRWAGHLKDHGVNAALLVAA